MRIGQAEGEGGHEGVRGRWALLPAEEEGSWERAAVSSQYAARCRQQHKQASCQSSQTPKRGATHHDPTTPAEGIWPHFCFIRQVCRRQLV